MKRADKIIAPSAYMSQALQAWGFKSILIPNFIDIAQYNFRLRADTRPKLLWVRSFHQIYNAPLAIEIIQVLRNKMKGVELCMVGPDKDGTLTRCKNLVKTLGLEDCITFTGKLSKEEIKTLSTHYDFFVNTTTIDNHPVSVIEAMALGLVVISTNVGGIPYLIQHEQNGLLAEATAEQFAKQIEKVIGTPGLFGQLQSNARSKAEDYDWAQVKPQWMDLLGKYFI